MAQYLINFLISLDQVINSLLGGSPKETLSSVAYRKDRDGEFWGFLRPFIDFIFMGVPTHCQHAYGYDRSVNLPK
jgi:hypothetical protein